MEKKSTVALLAILCCILSPIYGQWTKHIIDPNISYTCFIKIHDIGDDGDMDVFVSEYGANTVLWYENINMTWIKHTIDNNAVGVVGLDLLDVNDDGNMDVAVACWSSDIVAWYENDGADTINWTKHIIDNTFDGAEPLKVHDINGDGAPDVVVRSYTTGEIVWYENNYPEQWNRHIISSNMPGAGNIYIADINNDDKPDVVRSGSSKVILFMNNLPDTVWTEITVDENMPGTFMTHIADIDNDGNMDLAATAERATGSMADVAWYENDDSGQTWTKHTISADLVKARCLYIEDIDNNDYMDVVVADNSADDIIVFFNMDGGQNWTEYMIDNNFNAPNPVFAYDIDLDNDFDILPTSQSDNALSWYENPHGTAYATSFEVSPYSIQSSDDTLTIRANLHNPDSHLMSVYAVITGEQSQFVDTLALFDDGMHGDGDPSDHVWANIKVMTGFPEDGYEVDLVTYDSTKGNSYHYVSPDQFITFGPVSFEDYTITSSHQVFSPAELIDLTLTLKNNGTTAVAPNISAKLVSLDPNISVSVKPRSFGSIAAGESSTSDEFQIYIAETCPVNTQVPIAVDIYYELHPCWRDTLSIFVYEEQPVNILDTAFLYALIDEGVDTNGDSLISYEEAEAITSLIVEERGISDMTGIEAFVNLDTLDCGWNQLTSLDVSNNTALTSLSCPNNQLTSLDLSKNTALMSLYCHENQLSNLDISNSTSLDRLGCWQNQLTSLDVSNNTVLICLMCHTNLLTSLDISNNLTLEALMLGRNLLTSLDISNNIALGLIVPCWATALDISSMPSLYEVCVWETFSIDSVDVDSTGSPNVCFQTDCNGDCSIVGIEEYCQEGISIYPNPTNSLLTIEADQPDHYSIEITSLNGQLIHRTSMEGTTQELGLSPFPKGVYLITIRSKDFVTTRKIIKL